MDFLIWFHTAGIIQSVFEPLIDALGSVHVKKKILGMFRTYTDPNEMPPAASSDKFVHSISHGGIQG